MRKLIAPLLLAAFLFNSCPDDPNKKGSTGDLYIPGGVFVSVDTVISADIMGMVHAGSTMSIANDAIEARFDVLDEIGVKWMLDDFSWSTIQREINKDTPSEEWNWSGFDTYVANANSRGKKILALLDYDTEWLHGGRKTDENGNYVMDTVIDYLGNPAQEYVYNDGHTGRCIIGETEIAKFCEYVRATVTRYNGKNDHGKVDAWGIWNEPNLQPRFWTGTMTQFFELSIAAAKTIREADLSAVIIVGALNSIANDKWIRGLYSSGAVRQADFVGYHPYNINAQGTENIYKSFVEKSASSFRDKMWITEVGHPTGGGYPTRIPERRMPQTIVKTVVLLAASGAQKIFWYHLSEGVPRGNESDSENWFGLYTRDSSGNLTPKGHLPAAYKLVAEHIPGKTWRKDGLSGLELPASVQSHYFDGDDGKRVLVVWNNHANTTPIVNITLPGTGHILHDPADGTSVPVEAAGTYQLTNRDAINEKVLFFVWEDE